MVRRFGLWVSVVGLALSACEGGDGDGGEGDAITEEAAAAFDGVYRMTSWTENPDGCEAPGEDVLESEMDTHLVLVSTRIFGQTLLMVVSCAGEDDCADKASAIENEEGFGARLNLAMSEQLAMDDLRGFTAWTGFERDGVCTEREYEGHAAGLAGETLTVTTEVFALEDQPPDEDGFCFAEGRAVQKEAEGAPCVRRTEIVAERE